jgi:ABC-type phosphate transport system substrate-binding protein
MIRQRVSLAVAGAVVATTGLTAGLATSASAAPTIYDPTFTPTSGDLSGAGSDTTEIALDYLTKGHNGIEGFNGDKTTGRIASFAAGFDPTTVVLKSGSPAITRPNGSGAGKTLLRKATNNADLDFARSSSGLSTAEIADDLQQSPFAVDGLKLAASATSTNAPASISNADMVGIYQGTITKWNQLTGNSAGSSATIVPLIPQSGSGTRSFFEAQLKKYNEGTAVKLGASVKETQEHSDVDLKSDPNAIAPFSTGRAKTTTTIKELGGFSAQRALYNVVRKDDLNGSKGALLQSAFGTTGFVCSPAAKPLIEAAGFDQLASTTAGGVCGTFSQVDATNFTISGSAAQATSTALTVTAGNDKSVKLSASVNSASGLPSGKVVFSEGGVKVGGSQVISGTASLTLSNVGLGAHTYTATYNPSNAALYATSQSSSASATVLKSASVSAGSASTTYGQGTSIPVRVTADGAPAAGGTVTVSVGGAVSTVAVSGGAATVAVPGTLSAGSYAVSVTYSGDASTSSSSASGTLSIAKASSSTTLKLSKKVKASKKAKATVTVKAPGSFSGKVTLKAGSKTVGTGTVKNGKVTIALKKLKKGSYKIKATFAGNGNVNGSTSKTIKLKVVK